MSRHSVTTETTGEYTEITVDGLLRMTVVDGLATIHLDNENVHMDRSADVANNALSHPRLAYDAPELRDLVRAELGL